MEKIEAAKILCLCLLFLMACTPPEPEPGVCGDISEPVNGQVDDSVVADAGVTVRPAIPRSSRTQLVLLGTGTPIPEPENQGSAVAVVVDGVAYLVDLGVGVVRSSSWQGSGSCSGTTISLRCSAGRVTILSCRRRGWCRAGQEGHR